MEEKLITWVEFYDPFQMSGGGPTVNRKLIQTGRELGHNVKVLSAFNLDKAADLIFDSDLFILCDVFNEPTHSVTWPDEIIRFLIDNTTYFHFDNAYVDCCLHPYGLCLWQDNDNKCWDQSPFIRDLYANAEICFFVSNLHGRQVLQNACEDLSVTSLVYQHPLSEIFYDRGCERVYDYCYVGTVNRPKGWYNIQPILQQAENPIVIGDWRVEQQPPKYWRPRITPEQVAEIFNRSERFIHMPEWPEPCGLTVREAQACGCEIVDNGNVGALTYNGFELGPEDFWDVITQ